MDNLDYKSDLWVSPQWSQLYSEIEIPTLANPNSNVLIGVAYNCFWYFM